MPTDILYKISNRLMADNTAFYELSGINPITGNPIYRNSFTHSFNLYGAVPTRQILVEWLGTSYEEMIPGVLNKADAA